MVESSDTDLNNLLMLGVDGVVLLLLDVEGLGCLGVLAAILGWLPEGLLIFRGFLVEFIVARFCLWHISSFVLAGVHSFVFSFVSGRCNFFESVLDFSCGFMLTSFVNFFMLDDYIF